MIQSIILHQPYRCIRRSDLSNKQKLINLHIYNSTLHKIFRSLALHGLVIFSSLYSFRPFSIPWTKTTQDQYLGPNTQGQYLGSNTLDQYLGSKYLGPNTLDQKLSCPRYLLFSFCESACVCIRYLCSVNPRVYATWSK